MNAYDLDRSQEILRKLINNIKHRWELSRQKNFFKSKDTRDKCQDTMRDLLIEADEWNWKRKSPK